MPITTHSIENERIYITKETALFTAVTPTNSNACRLTRGTFTASFPTMIRRDKTGSFSVFGGQLGRIGGSWSLEMDLAGNGTPTPVGVPDANLLIAAAFGQDPTVVTGSVTYNNSDSGYLVDIWDFSPAGYIQFAALGCLVSDFEIAWGDNFAVARFSGDATIIMDNKYFPSAPTGFKMGLSSYPSEPTTPVTSGNAVVGFDGIATLDGNVMPEITTGSFRYRSGRRMIRDTFGSYIGTGIESAKRNATMQFLMNDQVDAHLDNLLVKSKTKAAMTLAMQLGTTAGNIWTPTLNNVLMVAPSRQENQLRFSWNFPESMGQETNLTALDECALVLT